MFPWKRLAEAGLGVWPNAQAVARQQAYFNVNPPSITWYQQQLKRFGYAIEQTGEYDVSTKHVLAAFQMRFRPQRFDGVPDAQTAAMLQVLNSSR
ncbi:N-acetylmuramoyl-L-alanine amidase AmiD [compost metagenome]